MGNVNDFKNRTKECKVGKREDGTEIIWLVKPMVPSYVMAKSAELGVDLNDLENIAKKAEGDLDKMYEMLETLLEGVLSSPKLGPVSSDEDDTIFIRDIEMPIIVEIVLTATGAKNMGLIEKFRP